MDGKKNKKFTLEAWLFGQAKLKSSRYTNILCLVSLVNDELTGFMSNFKP